MKEAVPGPSGQVVTPTSWCGHGWTLVISLDSTVRGFLHSGSPMKLIYALNARMLRAWCVPGTVLGAGDPTTEAPVVKACSLVGYVGTCSEGTVVSSTCLLAVPQFLPGALEIKLISLAVRVSVMSCGHFPHNHN